MKGEKREKKLKLSRGIEKNNKNNFSLKTKGKKNEKNIHSH